MRNLIKISENISKMENDSGLLILNAKDRPTPNAKRFIDRTDVAGKDAPKAPTMHIKPKDPRKFSTPAPGAYNPEAAEKDVKQTAPR